MGLSSGENTKFLHIGYRNCKQEFGKKFVGGLL